MKVTISRTVYHHWTLEEMVEKSNISIQNFERSLNFVVGSVGYCPDFIRVPEDLNLGFDRVYVFTLIDPDAEKIEYAPFDYFTY